MPIGGNTLDSDRVSGGREAPVRLEESRRSLDETSRSLLGQLLEAFRAERAFFVICWGAEEAAGSPTLEVVAALDQEGASLGDPDYLLDHAYLLSVGRSEGARLRRGVDEGVARSLLSCTFLLSPGAHGIVALETGPEARAFPPEGPGELEGYLARRLGDLRTQFLLVRDARRIAELEARVAELERQVEFRELELGGIRSTLEEDRFFQEDVTHYQQIVSRSPKMKELFEVIERVKDTDINILITGETGTGKELVARAIHFGGARSGQPFEVIACGSIPENLLESELFGHRRGAFSGADRDRRGVFERATGGTAFLDEIADMPPAMQQRFLRVLQERVVRPLGSEQPVPVDVRVISSTRKDLAQLVGTRAFREDLFYRLNVITIEVPPLRERKEDIPLLLEHFLDQQRDEREVAKRFSETAVRELMQYSWPGNVQELKNVVTRAYLSTARKVISRRSVLALLTRQIGNLFQGEDLFQDGEHLRLSVPFREGFNEIIAECERLILLAALRRNRGNKSRVTQQLGIPRQTLYNKLEKLGITEQDYLNDA